MISSHARAATPHASKYLVQLSKHWSHRFPELTYTPERADVPLPLGPCTLEASADALDITVAAQSDADLARLQQVVAEHLLRFAHRETLAIDWTGEGASTATERSS